ncbi:MAG TPA: TonB-dependent receptor [Porticoccaceae bacterium]|nr:TonB-dependent receptor [Porticoccaceae bacterium]
MNRTALYRKLLTTTVSAAVLMSSQLFAGDSNSIDEIIVTAQKRDQSILDIPFAISAFGEKEIKARGASDIKDMQYSVPGLSITNNQPGQDRVQIRGASSGVGLGSPTVGRYMDEVGVSSDATQRALDIPLLDIQRIEVLRGPQGTLYGAGSIGGTIRFISNSPDLDEVSGSLGIGFSSIDDGSNGNEINGVVNLPIIEDKLAIRIAASTEDIGGWIDNTAMGESDVNEAERDFVRAKVLFKPSDSFNASFMWMHYEFEQDNNNHELSESGFTLLNVDNRGATNEREVNTPFATPVSDEWDLLNLILNYEIENATILSSTGYLDRKINFKSEFVNAFFPPNAFGSIELEDRESETLTQEIRVNSNWDKPLNYTVGAFYRKTDTSQTQILSYPVFFGFPPQVTTGAAPIDSKSWAAFGELSYEFSETFTASFGMRYFEEDQEPSIFLLGGPAPMDMSPEDQSFDAVTPRLNFLWSVSESTSLYATMSKGFRSGGINGAGSSIPSYAPEEAILYEIGGRGEFLDGRVYVDGAIYHMDFDDVQVAISENGYGRTTNVDSASGPGVDLAVRVNITDDLTFNLTAGYVGREYDKVDSSAPANVAVGDASQYTPKHTASASLAYDFNWSSNLGGMARLDLSHADGFSVFVRTFPMQPVIETDPLTYLSFRVGAMADNWQVVLSADNLLDEEDGLFPGGAFSLDTYARPRTVALKAEYSF